MLGHVCPCVFPSQPFREIIVPVKVLRPLDAVGDNTYAFTDAKTDGNILKVAELLKKGFKDWRKGAFE